LREIYRPIPIFLTTLTAALFTILGEPDLLFNLQNVTASRDVFLFSGAVKVARGDMVQIWTLYDYSTLPYLHYLTHHLPQAMGLPAAFVAFIGLGLALWHRPVPALILISWIIPYFFMVGGLHAKPIRYALPLLPPLTILSAWTCIIIGKKIQQQALPLAVIGFLTTILGIAQMRIYTATDSRFTAASWIAQNIPKGDAILVERGGFPTDWMAPADQYNTRPMQGAYFIDAEGFLPYWGQVNFIQSRLNDMRWIVLTNENRMQQYRAVPNRYPIAHTFYQRLENGVLGFEKVATFKIQPGISSWNRSESQADPTATAFDHPHIIIYRSKDKTTVQNNLLQWADDVSHNPKFPDALIQKGMDAYRAQSYPTASYNFEQAIKKHPNFVLGYLMLGSALNKQNRQAESLQALQKAQAIHKGVSLEAGSGLVLMGMKEEGARFIENMLPIAQQTGRKDTDRFANIAAKAWFDVGVEHHQAQQYENARIAFLRSARIDPNFPPLYIHLGEIAETIGNRDAAIMSYQKFLELNPNNPTIQSKLKTLQNQ
ncbi:MAG: tetratricopeptide repeat protein, partial [Candidatus Latescibacteria bacterium]|nr:tetratricopeptide repeat protein [Candidatus Latescibacterota bacterium]